MSAGGTNDCFKVVNLKVKGNSPTLLSFIAKTEVKISRLE